MVWTWKSRIPEDRHCRVRQAKWGNPLPADHLSKKNNGWRQRWRWRRWRWRWRWRRCDIGEKRCLLDGTFAKLWWHREHEFEASSQSEVPPSAINATSSLTETSTSPSWSDNVQSERLYPRNWRDLTCGAVSQGLRTQPEAEADSRARSSTAGRRLRVDIHVYDMVVGRFCSTDRCVRVT